MRVRRWLGLVLPFAWVLAMMPVGASADGGAYIDLDRTYLLVGSTGHAETYVSVPEEKQDLFERGPFYLYVTPFRSQVTEGRPLSNKAVRVATMTLEHDRGTAFELSASFTVPDLPGDRYALGVCNDPCTISGFREPLTGEISIVQTAREAELLTKQRHLIGKRFSLRRQARRLTRSNERLVDELHTVEGERSSLWLEVHRIRGHVADARAEARRDSSWATLPLFLWIATVFLSIGALAIRRRRRSLPRDIPVMVDPPREVERSKELSLR